MHDSLTSFPAQFSFDPKIAFRTDQSTMQRFLLCGMGGSHLCGGIIQMLDPSIPLRIHRSYGIPLDIISKPENTLVIASSYSGNTEEVIDAVSVAVEKGFSVNIITTGGQLASFALENMIPHIILPKTRHQPRMMLGHSTLALAYIVAPKIVTDLHELSDTLDPQQMKAPGSRIAEALHGSIPLIYTSHENAYLSYIAKIFYNETAKVPSYAHTFPELNHNEIESFDNNDENQSLVSQIHALFIFDDRDHPQIQKRMHISRELLELKGIPVTSMHLHGVTRCYRIFSTILSLAWSATMLAEHYGYHADAVPLIEEFKDRLSHS